MGGWVADELVLNHHTNEKKHKVFLPTARINVRSEIENICVHASLNLWPVFTI